MTVVNLGAMPTNAPINNGLVQIKRGYGDSIQNAVNGQQLLDGGGGYMQISFTPAELCTWIVKGNVIAHGVSDGAGWRRWDLGVGITPADNNGYATGFQSCSQVYDNNVVEWRTMNAGAMFVLNPGVAYTAYLVTLGVTGTTQYHTGPNWCRLIGRVATEGWT